MSETTDKTKYKLALYIVRHTKLGHKANRRRVFMRTTKYDKVLSEYHKMIDENDVYYPKQVNHRGEQVHYELCILANNGEPVKKYYDPEAKIMRNVNMVSNDGYAVIKTSLYEVEDVFKHWNSGEMLTFPKLAKNFFTFFNLTKTVTLLNNKLVIEVVDQDKMDIIIFKDIDESFRMYNFLKDYTLACGLIEKVLFLGEPVGEKKSEYYDKVMERLGVTRTFLINMYTR